MESERLGKKSDQLNRERTIKNILISKWVPQTFPDNRKLKFRSGSIIGTEHARMLSRDLN